MKLKMYTLLLSAAISITAALAQPVIGLQRTIGGSGFDYFTCMSLAKDNGFIVGGYSASNKSGNKLENNKGGYDYWILLLNSKGGIRGQKTIGGSDFDQLQAVEQTTDGGYILGGYSYSNISGDKTENSRGGDDYWVVKLDSTGNVQWDKTIGGDGNDELYTIKQTSDGGYIAGGSSRSLISGEKTETSRGGADYWVVKLDANGNIQWDKTIGGSLWDVLFNVIQTNDGGYLLGGTSSSSISGEKTDSGRGAFGGKDYWIVKLDNAGNIQWDKTYGGYKEDDLRAIVQTNDGGYMLGGSSESGKSREKMQGSRGDYDYWIIKTDNLGQVEWSNTYGGSGPDYLSSLELTSDGGYILAGYSESNIYREKTESSRGYDDYWIIKLSSSGAIQWDKTIGCPGYDEIPKIKEIAKNRYLIAGATTSGIGGDKTEGGKGGEDYWLVELRDTNQDNIANAALPNTNNLQVNADKSNNGFSVYPNPATNVLHIKNTGKASFNLSNEKGKTLLTKTITNNGSIDVSKLQPGVYYLKNLVTGEGKTVLIIQ
jgi:hypothetical protein